MDIKHLLYIIMAAVFVNNYVLQRFLGICPFLGVSKKLDQATGMSIAVIFVMLLATAVTWPIQNFLLTPRDANGVLIRDMGYLQTVVFILVIAALVQLVEIILNQLRRAGRDGAEHHRELQLCRVYGQFLWLRLGLLLGYGHFCRSPHPHRELRGSQELPRSSHHTGLRLHSGRCLQRLCRSGRDSVRLRGVAT